MPNAQCPMPNPQSSPIPKTAYMPDSCFRPNSDSPSDREKLATPPSRGEEPGYRQRFAHSLRRCCGSEKD